VEFPSGTYELFLVSYSLAYDRNWKMHHITAALGFRHHRVRRRGPDQGDHLSAPGSRAAYNHKLVEVIGFVSHDFEDFSLFDPGCGSWFDVWLEYGGTLKSDTVYCCGDTAGKQRKQALVIEDVPIPLVEDDTFRHFDKAIQPPFRSGRHGAVVQATLVGRFFSGREQKSANGTYWGGYGHMGCCSLLAIEKITSVDSEERNDLDHGASTEQPDISKKGCGYRDLLPLVQGPALIQLQREAEAGERDWSFGDARRVAASLLKEIAKADKASLGTMQLTHDGQGRKVFSWAAGKDDHYMVVVSRPYWLSFYACDRNRVAWVPIAAYESSCGKKNSVVRLK
jgi:hypothetical protein